MKKLIITIVIGLSLVLVGGAVFVIGGSIIYKNNGGFDMSNYETKTVEIVEEFKDISIDLTTFDVTVRSSTDDKVKVVYLVGKKESCTISVVDSVLKITDSDDRNWFEKIFTFGEKDLIIYLPEKEYNDFSLDLTTGDLKLLCNATFSNANVEITTGDIEGSLKVKKDFTIKSTTGDVDINNVSCEKFSIVGTSGDVELNDVIASETFKIKTTTGDVEFTNCDGKDIEIKATTGDVIGSLLTGKTFTVKSTTGEKIVPPNSDGGTCKITVTTGDVKIKISNI